ncbi:5-methylthioadenosine/S-adenosylhomocysteine deaminase [Clostridium tetanomorphum]|uniref:Amidohydrolase family protein n=1 Tax=Clostridium tetanomorphum TaxID=1553 RepID=A0A923EBK9_CLOTT|nr:amidohydrolase family protein [Clostridium tetanomorphum]KAJ50462.1 amidohydrolase [Clostridium tetanomorphum DSM 665]MBC2398251.1 amidohydrolase family protein [Clostridium tetanomorphum]MBP1865630.1 5-methylthioadenosine/S-adenosylhomocysteine deaminase [Clostridium tetanomorphum]NRS85864.1 5-methylthioadenosine/S-adenosylhomocysteine deaminase [Clostridium tetanomorphum]NRZ96128.1 5-methylthioadenosine/S-adenosylhomocysteine deaminase [Clostridium tetanomorphum]
MDRKALITGNIKKGDVITKGYILSDLNTGLIENVNLNGDILENFQGKIINYEDNFIINAGDFNCHSHPEQSIYTDIVDKSWDLGTWCRNTIYKYSIKLEPEHIYLGCLRAFSRMLTLGVTSVMVSFYCHGNKGNLLDKEVIRAAKDVGIRLYFGRMNYDIINEDAYEAKKASQKSYNESPDEAEINFMMLSGEICSPNIIVAPSLHSIHASTKEAIIKGINLAFDSGKYIQFHLSEDEGDVDLSLKLYGLRPIEFLESLLKNKQIKSLEHVILSDCIWINDNERDIIKKYDMKVVLNPRMNDRIKAGEANLKKLLEKDIKIYLGTDGEASNDNLSITGERDFLKSKYKDINTNIIENLGKFPLKFNNGFIGDIEINNFCDLKITDINGNIKDVFVGGKKLVKDGKLISMDMEKSIEIPLKESLDKLFK